MFLEDRQQQAAYAIVLLGIALIIALFPFASGLLAIPVLYVVFKPVYTRVRRYAQPRLAAAVVTAIGVLFLMIPLALVAVIVAHQAQSLVAGAEQSRVLGEVSQLRLGSLPIGPVIANMGRRLAEWISGSGFAVVGAATRFSLNLVVAFFGLFYILQSSERLWLGLAPYIPFSTTNTERLRKRFEDITVSTVIGTGLTAAVQGTLVGVAFWATGLANAVVWGVITAIFSILPVVGSGMVWVPGALVLALDDRMPQAVALALWGIVVIANTDNLIRPMVFRRWANVHPLITIVGAFGGVRYFGLLGLLVGPLALSYFFELLRMYRQEYVGGIGTRLTR
jgi:predicted PurR-regulated permease PerM